REHRSARVVIGILLIVLACVILVGTDGIVAVDRGALLIVAACLCWAVDNNLTRRVAGNDAMLVAAVKGVAGGVINVGLAILFATHPLSPGPAFGAGVVGLLGYGVSLVLFVVSLRELGVARASAYFAAAPFIGVAVAFA